MVSYFYNFELMSWLYPIHGTESPEAYQVRMGESAAILSLVMFGFVAISTVYVFGTLLTANGNLKALNIIAASGVVISVVMNISLVPQMEALGSAYASLTAQFVTSVAQVIAVQFVFKFRVNYKFLSVLLIFVIGVYIGGYFSKTLSFDWQINALIMIAYSVLLSFLLRLLHLKKFLEIIKSDTGV